MGNAGRSTTQIILLKAIIFIITMKLLHVTLLLCAAMALTSAKCRKHCPPGWRQYHGRCYKYVATKMTWPDAEKNCLDLCGNLVSISDAAEQSFVRGVVKVNKNSVWIGGHDRVKEGFWLWSDGTKMTYTGWSGGEPNNGGAGQDCMQMYAGRLSGEWDDYNCSGHRASVCVKPL